MVLTGRQQRAKRTAEELGRVEGCWVTSPLPLDENSPLRFQVLDGERNRVLQMLSDAGYEANFVSILPRVTFAGMAGASLYEIHFPKERQEIPQDSRIIPKDEIGKRKQDREVELMLEAIYGKRRK